MRKLYLKKRRFLLFFTYALSSAVMLAVTMVIFMSSAYTALAEAGASNHARSVLYSAMQSAADSGDFSVLTEIIKEDGRIIGVSLNPSKANRITALFSSEVNAMLSSEKYSTFHIPVGNLTGIPLLSGRGIKIPLRLVPLGSIDATVKSDFSDAGINQTKHSVYIDAKVTLRLMAPFSDKITEVRTCLPLSETVIAGEIPGIYAPGIK